MTNDATDLGIDLDNLGAPGVSVGGGLVLLPRRRACRQLRGAGTS